METLLVGVIVTFCVVFSAWRLISLRMRLRALDALSFLPGVDGLRRKTLAKLSGGGGCGTCQANANVNVRRANQRPAAPHR